MRLTFLLNRGSGFFSVDDPEPRRRRVESAIRRRDENARILWVAPEDLSDAVEGAVAGGEGPLVAGGGDGTVNRVAGRMAGGERPMGVLPLGTFNFIAGDLGMPLSPEAAVDALFDGTPGPVDTGEVNGHLFLHNVSLGIHSVAVQLREQYQRRLRLNKAAAVAYALFKAILRPPMLSGYIHAREKAEFLRASFVFIGVNRFDTASFAFVRRKSLDDGILSVFYAHGMEPKNLLKMAVRTLVSRRIKDVPDLECLLTDMVILRSRKHKVKLVADGEIHPVRSPVVCRVRPGRLRIILPPRMA